MRLELWEHCSCKQRGGMRRSEEKKEGKEREEKKEVKEREVKEREVKDDPETSDTDIQTSEDEEVIREPLPPVPRRGLAGLHPLRRGPRFMELPVLAPVPQLLPGQFEPERLRRGFDPRDSRKVGGGYTFVRYH